MEASKVTINPDVIRFQKMDRAKRTKLRRQNIIDLIKSKPYGTPIKLAEFAYVAQCTDASAYALIKTMIKKGIISKDYISRFRITYSVNSEPRTITPAQKPTAAPQAALELEPPVVAETSAEPVTAPTRSLEDYAREFAWEHNSDSLREFIKFMDGKELDMRRQLDRG